jgi:hypothetical protein
MDSKKRGPEIGAARAYPEGAALRSEKLARRQGQSWKQRTFDSVAAGQNAA